MAFCVKWIRKVQLLSKFGLILHEFENNFHACTFFFVFYAYQTDWKCFICVWKKLQLKFVAGVSNFFLTLHLEWGGFLKKNILTLSRKKVQHENLLKEDVSLKLFFSPEKYIVRSFLNFKKPWNQFRDIFKLRGESPPSWKYLTDKSSDSC